MSNIWEFLLQTATVSLTAGILLLLKKLFEDKLPPRWQYTIWFLLALRMILPTATRNRYVLLPLPVWIEALKTASEQNLTSVFSAPFDPVHLTSGLPWPAVSVQSSAAYPGITDLLFIVYLAGVLLCLLRYFISYVMLRRLIRQKSHTVSPECRNEIEYVSKKFNLPTCSAVLVEGLPSAFVCGIFRPVLVLPAGQNMDEKILLHELLHLKYRDALQNMFWGLLRALHWCNPFLQYVFNRIGNDMEALCDQRVLEHLEGEERRDYGRILLSMTNDRYPRAFGTSSLSNGAKNIALRIGCIARFKKYPKGMELVSVCIALMLISPLFIGTTTYSFDQLHGYPKNRELAFAASRLNRCTTVAGAIDTFYKALADENSLLLSTCSPAETHQEIMTLLAGDKYRKMSNGFRYSLPVSLNGWPYPEDNTEYYVYNLRTSETESDGYDAELLIPLGTIGKYGGGLEEYLAEKGPEEAARLDAYKMAYGSATYPGCAIYHLTISKDDYGWVVTQRQKRDMIFTGDQAEGMLSDSQYAKLLPSTSYGIYTGDSASGTIRLQFSTHYTVDNTLTVSNGVWGSSSSFDKTAKLNAGFYSVTENQSLEYVYAGPDEERNKITQAALSVIPLDSADCDPYSVDFKKMAPNQNGASADSNGAMHVSRSFEEGEWNGRLTSGSGSGFSGHDDPFSRLFSEGRPETSDNLLPAAYAAQISLNGEIVDQLILAPNGGES